MTDDSKNKDPEEEKNQASNDDDFGLPDFEFDALEDDDDEVATPDSPAEDATPTGSPDETVADASGTSEEEVPSLDVEDIEGMDMEGIEDVDLADLDDLGDLGDLDLEDLDLDDLDLDKELANIDEVIAEITPEATPEAASAERVEDIFDRSAKEDKSDESTEEPVGEIEGDGLFYEEESFDEFDMGSAGDEMSSSSDEASLEMDLGDGVGSSMFDSDDDIPDIKFEDGDEAIPFSQRPMEGAEGLGEPRLDESEEYEESVSEDSSGARSKFVRIVVFGIVIFVSAGFGFLYWDGYWDGYFDANQDGEQTKEVAKNDTEEPTKKTPPKENKPTETTSQDQPKAQSTNEVAKPETKPQKTEKTPPKETPKPQKTEKTPPKETPKPQKTEKTPPKETPKPTKTEIKPTPKQVTTRPAASEGVTTLSSKTGQRYLIVASFGNSQSAQKHASKLVAQGQSPSIIPPFDGAPHYRVAVASYTSLSEALKNLDGYRQQFGSGVWVLKY